MSRTSKEELNEEQRLAAYANPNSVSLIRALAGSGKTRVLRYRVPYLLEARAKESAWGQPGKVLLMAFNRSVAQEIGQYFEKTLPAHLKKQVVVRTFHSMATYMLTRFLDKSAVVATEFDIPKAYHLAESISDYIQETKAISFDANEIRLLLNVEAEARGRGKSVLEILAEDRTICKALNMQPDTIAEWCQFLRTYRLRTGMLTHDDTLPLANALPDECYHRLGFTDILADEMQDLNFQQRGLVKRFMKTAQGFTGVADQNQAIYGWTGCDAQIFENMLKEYPKAQMYTLEKNYRSTEPVLEFANRILKQEIKTEQELAGRGVTGPKPMLLANPETDISTWLKHLRMGGENWKDISILYRTKNDAPLLEAKLVELGVPYILHDNSFFTEGVVQDIVAYMNLLYSPQFNQGDYRRLFNHFNGIGYQTASYVWKATDGKPSKWDRSKLPPTLRTTGMREQWRKLQTRIASYEKLSKNPKELVKLIKKDLVPYWETSLVPGQRMTLNDKLKLADTFEAWVNRFPDFANGWDIVKTVKEVEEGSRKYTENDDCIHVMTAHKSKGLQWNSVAIWNSVDGSMPLIGPHVDSSEERRILYVAVTRAKTNLVVFGREDSTLGKLMVGYPTGFNVDADSLAGPFKEK